MSDDDPIDTTPVTELSRSQRRVFGVLLEKSFTTPEYYPMTLKAITTGCNQKSNRQPLTEFSEDDVTDTLEQLREMGLVAIVHTESGRTERFRHYARKRFTFSEPQLAIMTELLLRGRQTLGDLRGRASRMVAVETLEKLREELEGLQKMNLVQATGPLERRGVEVDHNLYQPRENRKLETAANEPAAHSTASERSAERPAGERSAERPAGERSAERIDAPHPPPGTVPSSSDDSRALAALERAHAQLQQENREMRDQLQTLSEQVRQMSAQISELRDALGG